MASLESREPEISSAPPRRAGRRLLALAIIGFSLIATLQTALLVKASIEKQALTRFNKACDEVTLRIRERLTAYALLLQGAKALFAASEQVDRSEWRTYVETLRADETVPGHLGLGFSRLLLPHEIPAHEAAVRAEGYPEYRVHPPGPRDIYSAIVFLEPLQGRNLRAFGYDMFSDPVRRAAMEQSRDTGQPALSGKVTLIQEDGHDIQAGTLMYVPVYRNGAPAATVEQKRRALIGWVYSPYRMHDLMHGIVPDWDILGDKSLDLHIYDGDQPGKNCLLFDNHHPDTTDHPSSPLHTRRTIDFNGRQWLLVFDGGLEPNTINYTPAWATAAVGLVISALLLAMLLTLFKRSDAQRMAEQFAAQIRGMAFHDSLTKLPNRRLLRDRLDMALAAGRRQHALGALMLLDLDNFKPLNDSHGHAAGDALLKEVARRLHLSVRETDTVARLGGDEFVILLPALSPDTSVARETAREIAETIRAAIELPYYIDPDDTGRPLEHRCSCSIGVTLFSGHETDQSPIVKRADLAMYDAKNLGRNRVAFHIATPAGP